jgi:uncharacterized membrane protein YozB (DUF420 family)
MPGRTNRGLAIARLLMVVGSLAPLFILWAIRGGPPIPEWSWVAICLGLAIAPNLMLMWRWRIAARRNDHRIIVVADARDQSEHLLVYLFAMLLPLYTANLDKWRDFGSVAVAFVFIVLLFWHMNLHYMNIIFALLSYRVYTIEMTPGQGMGGIAVVLLSKRYSAPPKGTSIDALRLSDTVFVEKEASNAQ